MAIPIRVEYGEQHIKPGEELEIFAEGAASVRVLDVMPIGDELRYRYVIVWENGDD